MDNLQKEIDEAVQYIVNKRSSGRPDRKTQTARVKHIKAIKAGVKKVDHLLVKLLEDIVKNDNDWYTPTGESFIDKAHCLITSALAPLNDALMVVRPQPGSKRDVEGRTAVRLAEAICGPSKPRAVRSMARRIMVLADVAEPEASTLTKWIKEMKEPTATGM